jgi:hypothetical protein
MEDGLGFSIVSGVFLEKVARDERLSHDPPRNGREQQRPARPRPQKAAEADGQDEEPESESPASTVHIDLRV